MVEVHPVEFPGQDVDSLRRKYTSIHVKKVPTGDPNIPEEMRLAKKVKYMIGDHTQLGGGGGGVWHDFCFLIVLTEKTRV